MVHVELLEDDEKNLFLSSTANKPDGVVYYATTSSLLCAFTEGSITLQTLFDQTPSFFTEITSEDKTALYSLNDIDVDLKCGDKTIRELEKYGLTKDSIISIPGESEFGG
jgi:hypothetical protein